MTLDMFTKDEPAKNAPLAERMRPRLLEEFVGQKKAVGPGSMLHDAIAAGKIPSMIFWGPPGTGKTTLARIIANVTDRHFDTFSAVLSGVKEVRQIIEAARARLSQKGKQTILFVDEIHRFNKSQQDSFLPHVEAGIITLIGATTENPSFEVNAALLSRCRVVVLEPLEVTELRKILDRALTDEKKGLGGKNIEIEEKAAAHLLDSCGGDARVLLNCLEIAAERSLDRTPDAPKITLKDAEEAIQKRALRYDKAGEEHYNVISAFIKSMRGSDPDAAVYYLARMLEAGEDPVFIARRMVILASEDVSNADPNALNLAVSTMQGVHMIGLPEAQILLAHCACYLACAPKSNRSYMALNAAKKDVQDTGNLEVPLHIRNAPTKLMKELDYKKGYLYDHDFEHGHAGQTFLPDALDGKHYYYPTENGIEERIKKRLDWLRQRQDQNRKKGDNR